MDNLKFKIISSELTIESYLDKVERFTGVRLPMQYALGAKIVGVYSHDTLVAGYMLVTKPSFRTLMFVPDKIKSKHTFFNVDPYEMMEVNGLWIGPGVKSPRAQFKVWLTLIKDIFLSKKQYLLLMSDSRNQTINKIHNLTKPTCLYEGTPQPLPGESTHKTVRIGFTTRWNLITNLPRYYYEYKKREQRANEAIKHRVYSHNHKDLHSKAA